MKTYVEQSITAHMNDSIFLRLNEWVTSSREYAFVSFEPHTPRAVYIWYSPENTCI